MSITRKVAEASGGKIFKLNNKIKKAAVIKMQSISMKDPPYRVLKSLLIPSQPQMFILVLKQIILTSQLIVN